MKVYLTVIISIIFVLSLSSKDVDESLGQVNKDKNHLDFCSPSYVDMDYQLDKARGFLHKAQHDKANNICGSVASLLDQIDIHIQEKISLANKISKAYFDLSEFTKGLKFAKKYLEVAKVSLSSTDYQLGKSYEMLGAFQVKAMELDSAIQNFNHALSILKNYNNQQSIHYNLGTYYLNLREEVEAVNSFSMAVDNFNEQDRSTDNLRAQFDVYAKYVEANILYQDFDKAKQCLIEIERLSKHLEDPIIDFILDYQNAAYYLNTGEPGIAITYLKNEIPEHPLADDLKRGYYYYSGISHLGLRNFPESVTYFQKSIDASFELGASAHKIGVCYLWLGRTLTHMKEYDKAIAAFDDALCVYDNTDGKFRTEIADIYNFKGRLYLKQKRLVEAKKNFFLALDWHDKRTVGKMENVMDLALVHLEYFNQSQSEEQVDSITYYMELNDQLLKQMRIEHRYFSDQGPVEYIANQLYSENLNILKQLFESGNVYDFLIHRFFKYVEGIKAYSFKQELKEQESLHTYGVPKELIDQLNLLKKQVKDIQEIIYKLDEDSNNLDLESVHNIPLYENNLKLDSLKNRYNSMLLKVESEYPSYFNYKHSHNAVSIRDIQRILDPGEAFIEYFTNDRIIFTISIEADKIHWFIKEKPEHWERINEDYSNAVTNGDYQHQDLAAESYTKFTDSAYELYTLVLKDVIEVLDDDVTHLTIVPDEQLHFIQFDNLLTEKAEQDEAYKTLVYLIKKYTTSRASSAFIYSMLKDRARRHNKYKYIGFAPKYSNKTIILIDSLEAERKQRAAYHNELVTRGAYNDLPSARESVKLIAHALGGISYVGNNATRETFVNKSKEGTIVHFAGHAIVDKQQPKYSQLLFTHVNIDSQLYASDIYDMGLDIDLAVLSACNTGNGEEQRDGEGVISLSRAFKYAGCSSLVMSLWNIPDIQTAELDYSFFNYIQAGERIDDALRKSKLKFLDESTNQTAHPFYWSGLTASGKMTPIKHPNLWDRIVKYFKH